MTNKKESTLTFDQVCGIVVKHCNNYRNLDFKIYPGSLSDKVVSSIELFGKNNQNYVRLTPAEIGWRIRFYHAHDMNLDDAHEFLGLCRVSHDLLETLTDQA